MSREMSFRIVLGIVCVSHIVLGLAGNVLPQEQVASIIGRAYSAEVDLNPQNIHLVRILGAFMIAIGLVAAAAWARPDKHRGVVLSIAALEFMRVFQRIIFADEIHETFQIPYMMLWVQSGVFAGIGVLLVWLCPKRKPRSS